MTNDDTLQQHYFYFSRYDALQRPCLLFDRLLKLFRHSPDMNVDHQEEQNGPSSLKFKIVLNVVLMIVQTPLGTTRSRDVGCWRRLGLCRRRQHGLWSRGGGVPFDLPLAHPGTPVCIPLVKTNPFLFLK
jgi:hypothetical protein